MAGIVKIGELKVETATVKLTKSLLKQFEFSDELSDPKVTPLIRPKEGEKYNPAVLGWIHGSVMEAGETYWHWLIVNRGDGTYLRVRVSYEGAKKYAPRQLYIV